MLTVHNQGNWGREYSRLQIRRTSGFGGRALRFALEHSGRGDEPNVVLQPQAALELGDKLVAYALANGAKRPKRPEPTPPPVIEGEL